MDVEMGEDADLLYQGCGGETRRRESNLFPPMFAEQDIKVEPTPSTNAFDEYDPNWPVIPTMLSAPDSLANPCAIMPNDLNGSYSDTLNENNEEQVAKPITQDNPKPRTSHAKRKPKRRTQHILPKKLKKRPSPLVDRMVSPTTVFSSSSSASTPSQELNEDAPKPLEIPTSWMRSETTTAATTTTTTFVPVLVQNVINLRATEDLTAWYKSLDETQFIIDTKRVLRTLPKKIPVIEAFLFCMAHKHGGSVLHWSTAHIEFQIYNMQKVLALIDLIIIPNPSDRNELRRWKSLRRWFTPKRRTLLKAMTIPNCAGLTVSPYNRAVTLRRLHGFAEDLKLVDLLSTSSK